MVGNLSTENESSREEQKVSVLNQITYGESINDLSKATNGQFILEASQYSMLREYTNFTEIRLFCRKKASHSRTLDVAITADNQIYDFLLNKKSFGSYCDKVYKHLEGDNSVLSSFPCDEVNLTKMGYSISGAIFYKVAKYHILFDPDSGRFECDDHRQDPGLGGVWRYFVR